MKVLTAIFPLFFATYPVLSLYLHNLNQVKLSEALSPLAAILAFTFFLLFGLGLILKSKPKASVVIALFLFMLFSYGHLFGLAQSIWKTKNLSYYNPNYFTGWLAAFAVITYLLVTTKKNLITLTKILAIVSIVLLAVPSLSLVAYEFRDRDTRGVTSSIENSGKPTIAGAKTEGKLPDIYYIVLDRYANQKTLTDFYQFDNGNFLNDLEKRGFFVAEESTANYLKTAHSLASTLNLEYVNFLSEELGEEEESWLPLYKMLNDYEVWRYLKAKGYKFIHLGSWWHPTSINSYADINFRFGFLPEFSGVLFRTTVAYPISVSLGIYDVRYEQWGRVNYKFEKLAEIKNMPEPTFVFAHMLVPHDPYVFDKDGSFISWDEVVKRGRKENFINQLIFTNQKILEIVDKILEASDQPIIIIQGDEGPLPERYLVDEKGFNWETATEEELKEKMRILNVLYLPGINDGLLYDSITPVNTFRIVFNQYFGEELELLPDKNFAHSDDNHPYKFFEVTDKVR